MRLILLGTGYAMATRCYNTCFALQNGEDYFLVDAGGGNGIFTQLSKARISLEHVRWMFLTHAHTDHVLGAIWIIRKIATLISKGQYPGNFIIYAHGDLIQVVTVFCQLTLPEKITHLMGERILLREVKEDSRAEAAGMQLQFFDIASTKLKQFGFRAELPDGQVLVCLGDEPYNEICRAYVEQADWLLAEAFCLYRDREVFSPYEKHHSTALDAGRLAEKLKVKNLVLYHTEDTQLAERKKTYTEEAQSAFSGNVFVPDDLEQIELGEMEKK